MSTTENGSIFDLPGSLDALRCDTPFTLPDDLREELNDTAGVSFDGLRADELDPRAAATQHYPLNQAKRWLGCAATQSLEHGQRLVEASTQAAKEAVCSRVVALVERVVEKREDFAGIISLLIFLNTED